MLLNQLTNFTGDKRDQQRKSGAIGREKQH